MPPLTMMIKPASSACNMRCAYCFYADVAAHQGDSAMQYIADRITEAIGRKP